MPSASPASSGNFQRDAINFAGDQARAKKMPKSQNVSGALVMYGRP